MATLVDAHHHIWRRADLPWLNGPMQPRIFGAYEAICRDYPIEEFRTEAQACGVEESVYVQANWPPEQFEAEARWVQERADDNGWPHAIVAYADLLADDVRPALDALARYPLVRGVRMQLHWHHNPMYRFAARRDLAADRTLRANISRLAEYELSFDLQVFASQMRGAAELAMACPDVTFVLQHAGMLEDLSAAGRGAWRDGMRALAAQLNVVTKLSALGTFIRRNDPAHIASIVAETVTLFGAGRCMFGSNFPIEKLWTDYAALLSAYQAATAELPGHARTSIFSDTARRVYRI